MNNAHVLFSGTIDVSLLILLHMHGMMIGSGRGMSRPMEIDRRECTNWKQRKLLLFIRCISRSIDG
jgi:hypothetical protein